MELAVTKRVLGIDLEPSVNDKSWVEILESEPYFDVDLNPSQRYATSSYRPASGRTVKGWMKPAADCPPDLTVTVDGKEVPINAFSLISSAMLPGAPTDALVPATESDIGDLLDECLAPLVKARLPACLFWSYTDKHLLPARVDLNGFVQSPDSCLPLKYMFLVAGYADIPSAIEAAQKKSQGLRNLLKRVGQAATKHVRAVWKEHRDFEIVLNPNGTFIEPAIQDRFTLFDMAKRSDGFKRFVSFLLMVSARVAAKDLRNVLFLQDEPDTGLHPAGARFLRDELIKMSAENTVVFSTHNIFMVDRERIDRHILVRKSAEITTVEDADVSNITDEEVIFNALGYSLFESLRPRNLLFEGWSDKRLFAVFLSGLAKADPLRQTFGDFGLCHVKGVKDIQRVTPLLELAGREWWVISDSDAVAIQGQRNYYGAGPWFRYDELGGAFKAETAEDFLAPKALLTAAKEAATKYQGLAGLGLDTIGTEPGRLARIAAFVRISGADAATAKAALMCLKTAAFARLSRKDIEPPYEAMVKALLAKVETGSVQTVESSQK